MIISKQSAPHSPDKQRYGHGHAHDQGIPGVFCDFIFIILDISAAKRKFAEEQSVHFSGGWLDRFLFRTLYPLHLVQGT